ncbi:helix-turn-helix domain-containing protein [Vibrio aerogenes]|uniref:helix-turn-helix domain-containing protein n=1 Tax=Vibrio aerogenes TaxID=92172 RepID=UPI0039F01D99
MKHIGDRLRYIMKMRGVNATTLARDLDLGTGHVSNIMTNRIQAPKKHLPAIAEYLQVTQSWLLTGEGTCEGVPVALYPVYEINAGKRTPACMCRVAGMTEKDGTYGVISDSLPDNTLLIVSPATSGDGLFLIEDEVQGCVIARRTDLITELKWTYLSDTTPQKPSVTGKIEIILDKETNIYEA